jgi:hypothetical protein
MSLFFYLFGWLTMSMVPSLLAKSELPGATFPNSTSPGLRGAKVDEAVTCHRRVGSGASLDAVFTPKTR